MSDGKSRALRSVENHSPPFGFAQGRLRRGAHGTSVSADSSPCLRSEPFLSGMTTCQPPDSIDGLQFAVEGNLMATTEQTPAGVSTIAKKRVFKNFINGEWIASRTKRT